MASADKNKKVKVHVLFLRECRSGKMHFFNVFVQKSSFDLGDGDKEKLKICGKKQLKQTRLYSEVEKGKRKRTGG